jgi:hypothetical protein
VKGGDTKAIGLKLIQVKNRATTSEQNSYGAPRGQQGTPKVKCAAAITSFSNTQLD